MASERQRPTSLMTLGSTLAQRSAMVPPACILRAVSLLGAKPNCGRAAAEMQSRAVIWELVTAQSRCWW